jgi:hypothetical protein
MWPLWRNASPATDSFLSVKETQAGLHTHSYRWALIYLPSSRTDDTLLPLSLEMQPSDLLEIRDHPDIVHQRYSVLLLLEPGLHLKDIDPSPLRYAILACLGGKYGRCDCQQLESLNRPPS